MHLPPNLLHLEKTKMPQRNQARKVDKQKKKDKPDAHLEFVIGRVVDTNDPQQMGRVRALCQSYGDSTTSKIKNIPWAISVSPLGGVTSMGTRGAEKDEFNGPVSYGMWNVPKIGAYVLIGCVEGNKAARFYVGCIQPQYFTHTMPHGRYTWNDDENGAPDGPLDTCENPIQPTYDNFAQQFTSTGDRLAPGTPTDPHRNMEWRSRGVDNQVSAITNTHVKHTKDNPGSKIADHAWERNDFSFTTVEEENLDERVIRGPGYGIDQAEPTSYYETTQNNYDSMIYSWTTPGFHSFSMDDRHENSRIRLRTTSGHQILMDDTNERIYISTAGGETWIEIDSVGNIDIFASKDISTHASGDINFTADKTFRVHAKEGIHLVSDDEIRVHSKAGNGIHLKSDKEIHIESVEDTHFISDSVLHLRSLGDTNIHTGLVGRWQTGGEKHLLAGGNHIETAPNIHMNGPQADAAEPAVTSKESFIATRIPEHEPWARIFSKPSVADKDVDNSFVAEPATYDDPNVGKQDRDGVSYNRNKRWHR